MTQRVRDFENTFNRAWDLLRGNWIIVVPGIVLGALGGLISYALGVALASTFGIADGANPNVTYVSQIVIDLAMLVVSIFISIVQMAFVTGMAGAAWGNGRASLRDGWSAFAHQGAQVAVVVALLFIIGFCAAALAPVTFFVTLVVYAVFFIYAMAATIIGKRDGVVAIVESARLTLSNFMPTLGIVALIALIAVVGAVVGALIGRVTPVAGGLVEGVLQQIIVAYATLVVAGEYLKLSAEARVS